MRDPHYPCNAVDDRYKSMCYWLQTDRMLQLSGDVVSIGSTCTGAPESVQFHCFYSMGRTVSSVVSRDPVKGFEVCGSVSEDSHRDFCLEGVLSDLFWDETHADRSVVFCGLSEGSSFEKICYDRLIVRASEVVLGDFTGKFCGKLPDRYHAQCISQEKPSAFALSVKDSGLAVDVPKTDTAVMYYRDGVYVPDTVHVSVGQEVTWG